MFGRLLLCCVCLIGSLCAQDSTTPGVIAPHVACQSNPKQTYALYLPSHFAASRKWPILYMFDPGARGQVAVETVLAAAEKFGYIVAASNNSRNGPMGGSSEAADAMWRDTQQRFSVDEHRRYFAGMSGGARVATGMALNCGDCVAGVIANAAGFQTSAVPNIKFSYFAAVGDADFNFSEFVALRPKLEQSAARYRIRIFHGEHGWAPPDVWLEALNWLDLQAMASGLMPRDPQRIQATLAQELEAARDLRKRGELLAASRAYQAVVRDFTNLADTTAAKSELAELMQDKAVRKAEKDELDAVAYQDRLSAVASSQMQKIAAKKMELAEFTETRDTMLDLSKKIKAAPNPDDPKILVMRRALGGLVVQAFESGQRAIEQKNYEAALQYFDLVAAGSKHPAWAHYQRALTYALISDKKGVVTELKIAIDGGLNDRSALDADEFKPYRDQPQFQALLAELDAKSKP